MSRLSIVTGHRVLLGHPTPGHLALVPVLSLLEADLERVCGGPCQVWAQVPVPQGLSRHPQQLSLQHLALDLGLACSSKTHLEAFLCGNEKHFEGLPTLEGDAGAPLLTAPFALFFGVEDNLRCVQPRVKVQGSICPLLLAA